MTTEQAQCAFPADRKIHWKYTFFHVYPARRTRPKSLIAVLFMSISVDDVDVDRADRRNW
jgi:hypothetical protein